MSWKTVNVTGNLLLSPPDDKHTRGVVHSTAFLDPPCNGKVACKLLKTATNSLKQLAERQKEQQLANDEVSELPVNFSTKLQLIWFQGAFTDCLWLRRRVVFWVWVRLTWGTRSPDMIGWETERGVSNCVQLCV